MQSTSDVALGRPKELLVSVDFGVPVGIGFARRLPDLTGQSDSPVTTQVIATQAGPEAVDLEVRTRVELTTGLSQPPSDAWKRAATLRVKYGSGGVVDLFYYSDTDPPRTTQVELRPQLLRDVPRGVRAPNG